MCYRNETHELRCPFDVEHARRETLVHPSWFTMMREIGVCRQRMADAITGLKAEGRLEVVTAPRKGGKKGEIEYWYEVKM